MLIICPNKYFQCHSSGPKSDGGKALEIVATISSIVIYPDTIDVSYKKNIYEYQHKLNCDLSKNKIK